MQKTTHALLLAIALTFALAFSQIAHAGADRDSLIAAWESHMATLWSTADFKKIGDNTYQLTDTELQYEGKLVLRGALVRPMGLSEESAFSHTGILELELADLPGERLASQLYYYWLADKQMLYYSTSRDAWVTQMEFTEGYGDAYDYDTGFGFLSFMLKYGIWILLIALIVFLFRSVNTQVKKNRVLMDDSAEINKKARENVERAQAMQDEVLAISRESLNVQAENNEVLKKILDALSR